jgi:photosystem II stability/assembly factor-like uncharacterized protein
VAWPEGTTVTNPGGDNPEEEGPANLVDGDADTKWLDHNFNADNSQTTGSSTIIIDAGEDVSFEGYEWVTANDDPERDPISWSVSGSDDGENWTLIDEASDQEIDEGRFITTGFGVYGIFFTGAFDTVTKTSATLKGDLSPGKVPLTEIGFEYATSSLFSDPSYVVVDTETYENTAYSADIAGLACGTRYFYKAYAKVEDDVVIEGDAPSFVTPECTDLADEPLDDQWYEAVRHTDVSESWTGVAASNDGQIMAATWAGTDDSGPLGSIYISTDGGTTWESHMNVPGILFTSIAMSADGQHMIAVGTEAFISIESLGTLSVYVSDDGGMNWEERTELDGSEFVGFLEELGIPDYSFLSVFLLMSKVSVSDDFSVIYASFFDKVYRSGDGGETWETTFVSPTSGLVVSSIDVSGDGQKAAFTLVFIAGPSDEFPSVVLSTTLDEWVPTYILEDAGLFSIDISSNGRRLFAIDHLGDMHVSFDEGVTWHTSENPDGYKWVSVIPSETGNGVFAAALSELVDEEGTSTILALYYSPDGGTTWEKMHEADVSDRSYALSLGPILDDRISAADDLSRIALTNLFDLYVVTRGAVVAPPAPPHHSSSGSSRNTRRAKERTAAEPSQTVESLIVQYHDLLLQAYHLGITLPPDLLALLDLPAPTITVPVRDLQYGMEGDDVRLLQTVLIKEGYSISAGATGYFGLQTQYALDAYQAAHGIAPRGGYFGPITQAQMKSAGLGGLWW